jgi:hypothetical protein
LPVPTPAAAAARRSADDDDGHYSEICRRESVAAAAAAALRISSTHYDHYNPHPAQSDDQADAGGPEQGTSGQAVQQPGGSEQPPFTVAIDHQSPLLDVTAATAAAAAIVAMATMPDDSLDLDAEVVVFSSELVRESDLSRSVR